MEPKIYFVENEAKTNELFAEFYLKQEDGRDVIASVLVDNRTFEVKESNIFASYCDKDGHHTGNSNVDDGEIETEGLAKTLSIILKSKIEEDEIDFSRNYFFHC